MGLFAKFFGNNQIDKGENTNNEKAKPSALLTIPTFEFYEKVIDNIVVSETLQSELKIKIKQAFENPKLFYNKDDEFILSDRGLTFPKDNLLVPKFVLVDTLLDNDQLAEVDWKEDEEEIRFALNRIIKVKSYNFKLSGDTDYENNDTFKIIKLIDKNELKPLGFSLEILDINSDSYVFTVVPLDKKTVVELMFTKLK